MSVRSRTESLRTVALAAGAGGGVSPRADGEPESADGDPEGPDRPSLKLSRAVYAGLARGGLERPVEALGDDKFRIAGIEFTRIH